ncbi:MAG: hypothetical protein GXO35_03620 [Gammaproteobacteria bacterium]|nr:hypothetical protein [Gammaproteobacteria bacterium]
MIKRLIAAIAFVYVSIVWLWPTFVSLAALFTFIPSAYVNLLALLLITVAGFAVFRILDFDNWGAEDALAVLYLGGIALYALTGDIDVVLVELIKNVVGFSVAFLIGIWAARGGGRR